MTTTAVSRRRQVAASVAGGGVYTGTPNGTTYVQLVASTSVTILVTEVFIGYPSSASPGVATLGLGAAGSEVAIATIPFIDITAPSCKVFLIYPIRIPAGSRLAMKRDSSGTQGRLGVSYINEAGIS